MFLGGAFEAEELSKCTGPEAGVCPVHRALEGGRAFIPQAMNSHWAVSPQGADISRCCREDRPGRGGPERRLRCWAEVEVVRSCER